MLNNPEASVTLPVSMHIIYLQNAHSRAKTEAARKGHTGPYSSFPALLVAGNCVLGADQCMHFFGVLYLFLNDMCCSLRPFVYLGNTSSLAETVYSPAYS